MLNTYKQVKVVGNFWLDGIEFTNDTSVDVTTYTTADLPKDFLKIPQFTRRKVLESKFEEAIKNGQFKVGTVEKVEEEPAGEIVPNVGEILGSNGSEILVPNVGEEADSGEEIAPNIEGAKEETIVPNVGTADEDTANGELTAKEQELMQKTIKELKEVATANNVEVGNLKKIEIVKLLIEKGLV